MRRAGRLVVAVVAAVAVTLTGVGERAGRVRPAPVGPVRLAAVSVTGNLLHNPSFETSTAGWSSPSMRRVWVANRIDGAYAARLSPVGSLLRIDNWPGDVTSSRRGATYTGTLYVRGNVSALGKPVTLVLREHDRAGNQVTDHAVVGVVPASWRRLRVTLTAQRDGDYVDLYAYQGKVAATDRLFVDAAAVTRTTLVAPSPPAPTPTTGWPVRDTALLAIQTDAQQHLGDTSGYDVVILQDYMYAAVPAVKAANPATTVLSYFEAPVTHRHTCSSDEPEYLLHDAYPLNWCWVQANHPDWFLRDSTGTPLRYSNYPADALMDVGNTGYQAAWASIAVARARADGFDGVYLDDISASPHHGLDGRIAKYTDQQYAAAVLAFVTAVARQLHAAGLRTAANVGIDPWRSWERTDGLALSQHLDYTMREFLTSYQNDCSAPQPRFTGDYTNGPSFAEMLRYYQQLQADTGTRLLGADYGGTLPANGADQAAMTYGRAAWLLAWDGRPGGGNTFHPCGNGPDGNALWQANPGSPTGATGYSGGLWRRTFTGGLVLLNPSAVTAVTATVPSGLHTATGNAAGGAVTLAPGTALVLLTG